MKKHLMAISTIALALATWIPVTAQQTTNSGQAASSKPQLVMIIAEDEYKTDQTLPPFAQANLAEDFQITVLQAEATNPNRIQNIDAVKTADVLLISVRRRPLVPEQLAIIRQYVDSGKPVVGIRTASHAFCLRNKSAPAGLADWPTFDPDVLGGHYVNHYGNNIQSYVQVSPSAAEHPIVKGIPGKEFPVNGSLYRCQPLVDTTTVLLTGRAEGIEPREPVAWTNRPQHGNRVFYTSLGHPQDFKIPAFVRLLRNAVYWAAGLDTPTRDVVTLKNPPDKDK